MSAPYIIRRRKKMVNVVASAPVIQESIKRRNPYRTALPLANPKNIDKQIYDMILDFNRRTRAFTYKNLWGLYAASLYCMGARRTELFLTPPSITKFIDNGETYYNVRRACEKRFEGRKPRRVVIEQTWKPLNKYEYALFDYLMDGKPATNTLDFTPLINLKGTHPDRLAHFKLEYTEKDNVVNMLMADVSKKFSSFFRADVLDNENNVIHNSPIPPHAMRHFRATDLFIVHQLPQWLCQSLIGWTSGDMVTYYADIRTGLASRQQLDAWKTIENEKRVIGE